MSSPPRMPERLRAAVAADLRPVRALPPPSMRALWAVPVIVAVCAAAWLYFGVRRDAGELGLLLAWGPLALQVTLGLALLAMGLHETVPGLRPPRELVVVVVAAALTIHLAANFLIWRRHPLGYGSFFASLWPCLRYEVMLGAPFLIVIALLALRALPMQPRMIGLLAGVGGGVIADASWRLVCPVSVPAHFLTAHLGGVVALGAAGYLLGCLFERGGRPAAFNPETIGGAPAKVHTRRPDGRDRLSRKG